MWGCVLQYCYLSTYLSLSEQALERRLSRGTGGNSVLVNSLQPFDELIEPEIENLRLLLLYVVHRLPFHVNHYHWHTNMNNTLSLSLSLCVCVCAIFLRSSLREHSCMLRAAVLPSDADENLVCLSLLLDSENHHPNNNH